MSAPGLGVQLLFVQVCHLLSWYAYTSGSHLHVRRVPPRSTLTPVCTMNSFDGPSRRWDGSTHHPRPVAAAAGAGHAAASPLQLPSRYACHQSDPRNVVRQLLGACCPPRHGCSGDCPRANRSLTSAAALTLRPPQLLGACSAPGTAAAASGTGRAPASPVQLPCQSVCQHPQLRGPTCSAAALAAGTGPAMQQPHHGSCLDNAPVSKHVLERGAPAPAAESSLCSSHCRNGGCPLLHQLVGLF